MEVQIISCFVQKNPQDLYEMLWEPESFSKWASGLANTSLERDSLGWKGQGAEGPIRITFTEHNALGVMDHWVDLGEGRIVYVPLRIIANGSGSEVMLTLFQQPDMNSEKFADDAAWVKRDLEALKTIGENS